MSLNLRPDSAHHWKIRLVSALFLVFLVVGLPGSAFAQDYSFNLGQLVVNVFLNEDGTIAIDYLFVFNNDPGADPIDFVDVGLPNSSYRIGEITAEINGRPIREIEDSPYVTYGVALGLGPDAIRPGESGRIRVFVPRIERVFFVDSTDPDYASIQFSPTWFDSQIVRGSTDLTLTFHFPPGVQPEEPRWHDAPRGFPSEPETGFDEAGRIFYTWRNTNASSDRQYIFGASVPQQYVLASAILTPPEPSAAERVGFDIEALVPFLFCGGFLTFFILIGALSVYAESRRKLRYLPPKISIGGHGIKRGLTAVEAAILLEQPMDKILTMILFSILKKGAASVVTRDPLKLDIADPLPETLESYETHFLQAFAEEKKAARRRALQDTMVRLVKSVSKKMKGFSRRETIAYYRDIMQRAWEQVETADTPEVKSQKFDEGLEWTMLDRNFDDRTREVLGPGPIFVPMWWHRYDPGVGRTAATRPTAAPSVGGDRATPSLPALPGSGCAVSVVNGVQNFSAGVIGSLSDFTGAITQKTNPPPVRSGSSYRGGGGSSCACACAGCACACACAGGGR